MQNKLKEIPCRASAALALKRASDIALSSLLLLLMPLFFIPIAVGIKLSSRGPVFFRQRRTGYRGREFTCYKFRTMRLNADSDTRQATRDDPRKTRFGEFLRRTSLDELPQLWNVLRGDMSIIGPRPHMLAHTEQYSALIEGYMERHRMRPGITGWAQVNGLRGPTRELWMMKRRVALDLWYIDHWSFALDCKILYRTLKIILLGDKNAL